VADIAASTATFVVDAPVGVTLEQVRIALKNANIDAGVVSEKANLAKLYRDAVTNNV
jgi:hypothetical protein